jgi:hypothetical protein
LANDTASALFGVEVPRVVEAESEADGTLTVWAVTGDPDAAVCPDCRTRSRRRAQDPALRRSRLVTGRKHDPG